MHEGGWKCVKRGRTEERGGKRKILERGGKLDQGVDALKRGLEPHYEL